MKLKKVTKIALLFLSICLFAGTATAATKTVSRVDRYGELYSYSGSPVVYIRGNVSAISQNAFNRVKTTRFVTQGNAYFKTVNGALLSKDGTIFIKCPTEKQGSFTIPSSVKKIAHSAFEDCSKLTRITMPDSVTSVDADVFLNCSSLREIRLSNNISEIPGDAFYGCSSLKSIRIPDSVISIESQAFYNCQSLDSISLPDSVSEVGSSAFSNCLNLKKARLSKEMDSISSSTFSNCTELKTLENAGNIEDIEWGAFKNCIKLNTFPFSNQLEEIGGNAFQNCTSLGTVVITKGTSDISYSAFKGAASKFIVDSSNPNYSSKNGLLLDEDGKYLIQAPANAMGALSVPRGVVTISSHALTNTAFSHISLPEGVTSISISHFDGCKNLKQINLPATITYIRSGYGNYDLNRLEKINVARQNEKYCSLDGAVFSTDLRALVFFPSGKKGTFHLPNECKYIGKQMKYNKLTSIHVSVNSKYFSSTDGVLYNKKGRSISCFPIRKKNYRIPAKVRDISYLNSIKEKLKCSSVKVSSKNEHFTSKAGVIFNSDADTLVFYPPKKKGSYKIPTSTSYIRNNAFDDAHELTGLTITKNVKRSRRNTFHFVNCKKLKSITVNQGNLNYISMNFSGCEKLSLLTFPSTIMTTNLRNLPEGVTIRGWKNTLAKEAAEDAKGKFVSLGTIPNVVSGVRIKKIIDSYQLSWNASGEASGYQVYTVYDTIKNLSGSGNTSCFIADRYTNDTIYIRAYKIVNNKKVYGKARSISIY